jgi:peroxiredoxin Q/BCP
MEVNDRAPDFSLPDENGRTVSLKDYRGKNVVLYFFPKADTPG